MADYLGLTTKTNRRHDAGRRRWDLPPNITRVLIAWAVAGPALVAALVAARFT